MEHGHIRDNILQIVRKPSYPYNRYYINITFHKRMIVKKIIPRNVIINRGAAAVDNHISKMGP